MTVKAIAEVRHLRCRRPSERQKEMINSPKKYKKAHRVSLWSDAQYSSGGYAERCSNGPSATESLEDCKKRMRHTAASGRGNSDARVSQ